MIVQLLTRCPVRNRLVTGGMGTRGGMGTWLPHRKSRSHANASPSPRAILSQDTISYRAESQRGTTEILGVGRAVSGAGPATRRPARSPADETHCDATRTCGACQHRAGDRGRAVLCICVRSAGWHVLAVSIPGHPARQRRSQPAGIAAPAFPWQRIRIGRCC